MIFPSLIPLLKLHTSSSSSGSHSTVFFLPLYSSPSNLYYSCLVGFLSCMSLPHIFFEGRSTVIPHCVYSKVRQDVLDWVVLLKCLINEWEVYWGKGYQSFGPYWHPVVASICLSLPSLFPSLTFPSSFFTFSFSSYFSLCHLLLSLGL